MPKENLNSTVIPVPTAAVITIFGTVTDMFGRPIPNATVTAVSYWGGIPMSVSTLTSENGSYQLEHAFGYEQNISVRKEGYLPKSWEKVFGLSNEFNMHIDIDRSTSQGASSGTLSPDETNASPTTTRPAPVPMMLSFLAVGIMFVAWSLFRKT